MKKVYRSEDNAGYWDRRWTEAGSDSDRFEDLSIYPIRFAEMVMTERRARVLEIGCGLGRVLKHYQADGFERLAGIERSAVAVDRLRTECPQLDIRRGDVLALPYESGAFDVVLAFGVYHNLETGLEQALAETARVLAPGGRFCISMRPDNIEMRWNELYWRWRNRDAPRTAPRFHKLLVGEREFGRMLAAAGLQTERCHYARNVSLLYRLPFLRARADGAERTNRSRGYRLNGVGRLLDRGLTGALPYQTANVLVYVGTRAADALRPGNARGAAG